MTKLAQKLKPLSVLQIGVVLLVAGVLAGLLHFYPKAWPQGPFITVIHDFYANASTELISIAITVLIIDRLYHRREAEQAKELRIRRYREEIEDYLGWQSEEATYRIVGLIKRLNQEGVTDINLEGAKLEGANLEGANLERAKLWRAKLEGANLKGANLEGAKLWEAKLEGANLKGVDLWGADLWGANLKGANLEGANLEGANLERANLEGARYSYKDTVKDTVWPQDFDPEKAGAIIKKSPFDELVGPFP